MAQYNLGRVQGLSAYEVAVNNGYVGTEEEWLTWLKAKNGTEVEINGELQSNVNFIRNEIVQDMLVYKSESNTISGTKITFPSTLIIEFYATVPSASAQVLNIGEWEGSNVGFCIALGATGRIELKTRQHSLGVEKAIYTNIINKKRNIAIIVIDANGVVTKAAINDTFGNIWDERYTSKIISETVYQKSDSNFALKQSLIYDKQLTQQEIQHNFSVLNNIPSINRINDYAISTDTDHIQDRTGRVQDTINRVFYKQSCKEFSSDGSAISVNNGMDGYVLSATLQGQTVKSCMDLNSIDKFKVLNGTCDNGLITLIGDGSAKYVNSKKEYAFVQPNTQYTMFVEMIENNGVNVIFNGNGGLFTPIGRTINAVGVYKFLVTTVSDFTTKNQALDAYWISSVGNTVKFRVMVLEGDWTNKPISYIPFGLHSTQAVISNNQMKYSFYSLTDDKLNNKVIELGGVGGVRDTLEIKEDGSGTHTLNNKMGILSKDDIISLENLVNTQRIKIKKPIDFIGYGNFDNREAYRFEDYNASNPTVSEMDNILYTNTISTRFSSIEFSLTIATNTFLTLEDAKNKLEGKRFLYTLKTPIVATIPKELMPTIITQATNTFTFGDAVAPYKVTIQAPVNKVADLETRLAQVEKVIASTSNLSLLGNYAEDEYNKEINQL